MTILLFRSVHHVNGRFDLIAKEAEIEIEGAGDVDVQTTKRLAVNCYGSSNVLYAGDPILYGKCEGSVMR